MPLTDMGETALLVLLVTGVLSFIFCIIAFSNSSTPKRLQRTETCHFCGYTWQMRRPHSIWNPPSRCPNCGKKLLRESEFIRALEENRKKYSSISSESQLEPLKDYRKMYEDFKKENEEREIT